MQMKELSTGRTMRAPAGAHPWGIFPAISDYKGEMKSKYAAQNRVENGDYQRQSDRLRKIYPWIYAGKSPFDFYGEGGVDGGAKTLGSPAVSNVAPIDDSSSANNREKMARGIIGKFGGYSTRK